MDLVAATVNEIDILTEMNIQLRIDEEMDNTMSEKTVYNRMKEFLISNDYDVFIIVVDKADVGYVLVESTSTPLYLRQLFIKKEFRQNGYGRLTLSAILEFYSVDQIDLEVMSWNQSAIKFYENFGFKKRFIGMRYTKG
jgi:ribosomal protein S18 acetylase RimI-like enzyme